MFDLRTQTKWKVFETDDTLDDMDRNSDDYIATLELRLEDNKGIIYPYGENTLMLLCQPRTALFLQKKFPKLDFDIDEDEATVQFPVDMLKDFGRQLYIIREKPYTVADPEAMKARMAKARAAKAELASFNQ